MKFKVMSSKFFDALKSVQNIVVAKGTLPVLQNVLIETIDQAIRMTTTDLDISIRTECACEVFENGRTTLPMKLLFNSISRIADGEGKDKIEIEIEIDSKERATIVAGKTKFKLVGLPAAEFPSLPEDEESYSYSIEQGDFREMLRKVHYAASLDDTRRTLKGVLMSFKDSKLTMVATDGRRLALVENELEFPKDAERDLILPPKLFGELKRLFTGEEKVYLKVEQTQASLKFGVTRVYSKLIDDIYPNYRQVIPTSTTETITVDRQLLIYAIERASVMTVDEAHSTKFIFSEGKLTVTSAASDIGEAKDEVPIKYAGETIEMLFNPSYLLDPLRAIDDDEVTIHLTNGHSPAIIKCSMPFLYVLMPLRIN